MFEFLNYLQPIWYYNLSKQSNAWVMLDVKQVNSVQATTLRFDQGYSSEDAKIMDAVYQGIMKGIIPNEQNVLKSKSTLIIIDVNDNYRFTKKYFSLYWCFFVLLMRLLKFYNPIREIKGFIKSLKVKRVNLYDDHVKYESFEDFTSELLHSQPLVSIIIPTLHRYNYLKDVFKDLEHQTYQNFEVLVCDQSDTVDLSFYKGWKFEIRLFTQEEKALWQARNTCVQNSKGEYILMFDDDSRVEKDWIEQHLRCLDYFKVKVSAGVTNTAFGQGSVQKESYFHLSDVFDTGNAMVHRSVFEKVGLFDCQFERQRMGDGEFGVRAFLAGYQIISNPYAKRIHLKVETGGLREMGSWDAFRPKHFWSPRPVPSTLYLTRKYFGNEVARNLLFNTIPRSMTSYKYKGNKFMKVIGLILLPLYMPIVFFQVLKSWRLSSVKLKEGDKIGTLKK